MIELQQVSFTYPQSSTPILQNFSFQITDKKAGIIGPNGCGKTTFLQLMVGLLQPDTGQILFNGNPVKTKLELYNLRKNTGFLFQNSDDQLFSPTVIEDVAFGPLNLGFTADDARDIAMKTLENLGLHGFENRITHRLSGGEKKLVALATILAMKPKLLLLDEPTNNLDPKTTSRLVEILVHLNLQQVIISHDWNFLSKTTDEIHEINHGQIRRCNSDHIHVHRHVHKAGDHPHSHDL